MTGFDLFCIFGIIAFKHWVCDFPLQHFPYMYENKHRFDHPGGYLHAGVHLLGMLLVMLVITTPGYAVLAAFADGVTHFFIDMLKMRLNRSMNWTPQTPWFYDAIGADQIAHFTVYFLICLAVL